MGLTDLLDGDEGTLYISASIEIVNRMENIELANVTGNNAVQAPIPVVAEAVYDVQV